MKKSRLVSPILTIFLGASLLIGLTVSDLLSSATRTEFLYHATLLSALFVSFSIGLIRLFRERWGFATISLVFISFAVGVVGVFGPEIILRSDVSYLLWGIGAVLHSRSAVALANRSPRYTGGILLVHGTLMAVIGVGFGVGTGFVFGGLLCVFGIAQTSDPEWFTE